LCEPVALLAGEEGRAGPRGGGARISSGIRRGEAYYASSERGARAGPHRGEAQQLVSPARGSSGKFVKLAREAGGIGVCTTMCEPVRCSCGVACTCERRRNLIPPLPPLSSRLQGGTRRTAPTGANGTAWRAAPSARHAGAWAKVRTLSLLREDTLARGLRQDVQEADEKPLPDSSDTRGI
jgi:hypothetical protein